MTEQTAGDAGTATDTTTGDAIGIGQVQAPADTGPLPAADTTSSAPADAPAHVDPATAPTDTTGAPAPVDVSTATERAIGRLEAAQDALADNSDPAVQELIDAANEFAGAFSDYMESAGQAHTTAAGTLAAQAAQNDDHGGKEIGADGSPVAL